MNDSNTRTTRLITGFFLMELFVSIVFTDATLADSRFVEELRGLLSKEIHERRDAAERLEQDYETLVKELLDIAKMSRSTTGDDDESSWSLAISMLGKLRARSAVPYLISEITTEVPTFILTLYTLFGEEHALRDDSERLDR